MISGYTIRRAETSDLPFLPDVEREAAVLFAGWESRLGIRDAAGVSLEIFKAAQESGRVWVAADAQNRPVAFALVREIDGAAHLEEMDVLPAHGRKGLGSVLLETVCVWAKEAGYRAVTLSTFLDVPWNAPFYSRRGFYVVERSALPSSLMAVVESEQRHGLRTDLRVIMRKDLW